MGPGVLLMVAGIGMILVRRPWARSAVRYTGFLVNKALDPDAVARVLGAGGLVLALAGAALAALAR